MQRKLSILLIGMLLFQIISGNILTMAQVNAESEGSDLFQSVKLVDGAGEEISGDQDVNQAFLEIEWGTEGIDPEVNHPYTLPVPNDFKIADKQQGKLTFEGQELGTYTATQENRIAATFNEAIKNVADAIGVFNVSVVVKAQDSAKDSEENSADTPANQADEDTENSTKQSQSTTANEQDDEKEQDDQQKAQEPAEDSSNSTKDEEAEPKQDGNTTQQTDDVSVTSTQEADSPSPAAAVEENIIDTFVLEQSDGTPVDPDDQINLEEGLDLKLEWSLPNGHGYTEGDTFKLQLPDQFAELNLPDGDLDGYGTYSVDNSGFVTFTFSESIEQESNITGYFAIEVELDQEEITTTEDKLEFKVNEEVVETIPVNYQPTGGQAINKTGQHGDDRQFNTETIDWTVDINTTLESLENAAITDDMQANLALDPDSIELYEAEVNINGEVLSVADEPVDISAMNDSTEEQLLLNLGDTNQAYQLKYTTNITDDKGEEYSNTATLSSDNKNDASSGATISVDRQDHLKKTSSAFNQEDHSVDWQVEYNFDEKQLVEGNELTDEFTLTVGGEDQSSKFEVTDINILQVESFNEDGSVNETTPANDTFDININGNHVTYTLNEDTNKPFIIDYTTQLKDDEYITHDGEISNTVTVDGVSEESGQGIGQQVGEKTHSSIDYENKTIDWTIEINQDNRSFDSFVLTDDFSGSGQKLDEDSIEISPGSNATPVIDSNKEGFKIDFGDISEAYTITYTTEFTYDFPEDNPNFDNHLRLDYETSNGNSYTNEITDTVEPNTKTTSNGAKNGRVDQETKEITWTTDINYNQLDLDNATFADEIQSNQSLIGSVEIYETTVNQDGSITQGDKVTDDFTVNTNDGEKIDITFGEIDQSYRIVFKTKDKDDIYNSDETYENTAKFTPREGESHALDAHVTLPHQGEFVGKDGTHNTDNWTIDWKIDINQSESTLSDVTVTDNLGDEDLQLLLEESFALTQGDETLEEGQDYELNITDNAFTLDISDEITDHYVLTYSSYILTEETADLDNQADITSNEEVVGTTEKTDTVEVKIGQAGGGAQGETANLTLEKKNNLDTDEPLEGVPFQLKTTVGNEEIVVREGTTNEDGEIQWSGLKYGTYTLIEDTPEGYEDASPKEVVLDSAEMTDNTKTLTIRNERETGHLMLFKNDVDTLAPLAGATFAITNADTGQSYQLTTNQNGSATREVPFGTYTIDEIQAPAGYEAVTTISDLEIQPNDVVSQTVYNNALTEVAGQKIWKDDNSPERPESITVNLKKNGEQIDSQDVTAEDNWQYSFTGLDKYHSEGHEHDYTVEEDSVDGYDTTYDGYDITNTRTEKMDIEVTKNWLDTAETADRPDSITVWLLKSGEGDTPQLVGTKDIEPDSEGNWEHTFTNIDKYDDEGNVINYTVEEEHVSGYQTVVESGDDANHFEITNVRTGTTAITGTKTWLDDNAEDRPNSVTVELTRSANGENDANFDMTKEVREADNWEYSFGGLPRFNEDGEAYEYHIDELNVDEDYEKSINGYDITNTRIGTMSVKGTKTWQDEEKTANRPESITVNLTRQDDEDFKQTEEVTAEDDWAYSFDHLDQYDDQGIEYVYEIDEAPVEGYDKNINGYDVTNTRSGQKSITVTKDWKDDNDATNHRPDHITVELYRSDNSEQAYDTKVIRSSDDWQHTFENLEMFDEEGQPYTYEVNELPVDHYETTKEQTENGVQFTNVREGTTSIDVTKQWNDNDNADNRPEEVEVDLYRSDDAEEPFKTATLTADDDWQHTFKELDAFDSEGVAYEFTVNEKPVDDYKQESITGDMQTGFVITNVATTAIDVTKDWLDAGDDTDRPDEATVELQRNGEPVQETTLEASEDWQHTFDNLEMYDPSGELYTYSVKEKDLDENYQLSSITGSAEDGFVISNVRVGTTSVEGTKTWQDDNEDDRPDSIQVNLLQNNVVIATEDVTTEDNWAYSFTDLDKYDEEGALYDYTVTEKDVPGYDSEVNGHDITNTRSEQKSIEITKGWLDDYSEDRPDAVTVTLLQNGDPFETVDIKAEDGWTYEFENLEAFDGNGHAYTYTVEEEAVEGYETTIDGFNITNLRVGETSVEGEKTWLDDDNPERPTEITVQLKQNGEVIQEQDVTAETNWQYEFTDLDKYDKQGVAYDYTIDEEDIDGYKKTIDQHDITNIRSEKTSVTGTKTWQDDNQEDHPDTITVHLLQNGEKVASTDVTAEDNWTYGFTDLERYDENGVAYHYTVAEQQVPGYDSGVDGYDITNTRSDQRTIVITKDWKDGSPADRPDAITVTLLQNGETFETVEVTAEDNWTYEFENLEAYDENGNAYNYTVEEEPLEGYKTTIDGFDITNTRVGTTTIDVSKQWKNDTPTDRPDSIIVELRQNGNVVDTAELTADMDWAYRFTNLEKYDENGVAYDYTVHEQNVEGYQSTVEETDNSFEITNNLEESAVSTDDPGSGTDNQEKQTANESINTLPQTGEEWLRYLMLLGFLSLGAGGILLITTRKRKLD
ncbi:Cna B-type domain-containing protein [Lentibacillus salicampi]|uniref:Cna B-type domain-containing protein n=1 Tax=Lentibacillus salicampi TaxID=175306 RepID=A0A4Y9ABA2_9BACI|nr:Cna B-type domain-containing protein [Lentibacillus salicampi]TFJ93066.1 Cna B-type domain-containing protein [Lentibacillus salicampi]